MDVIVPVVVAHAATSSLCQPQFDISLAEEAAKKEPGTVAAGRFTS